MKTSSSGIQDIATSFYILAILLFSLNAGAQPTTESSGNVKITIEGTSNIHDWKMNSDKGTCQIIFDSKNSGSLSGISDLSFKVPAESLKSESKAMDKNAFKALKSSKYSHISFSASDVSVKQSSGNSYLLTANGKLTISGISKDVILIANAIVNSDNSITYSGSYKLKMTDYEVEPPRLMFGAIKTGNSIVVKYDILLKGTNYLSQLIKN
jgi:hypothetical protein